MRQTGNTLAIIGAIMTGLGWAFWFAKSFSTTSNAPAIPFLIGLGLLLIGGLMASEKI
jgi:sulfite exporter TauE/SafE